MSTCTAYTNMIVNDAEHDETETNIIIAKISTSN